MHRLRSLAALLVVSLLPLLGLIPTSTASAATNSCISTESCGGATLALGTHGPLSLGVLAPSATTNGGFGYNNESVGFTTSGLTDGSQDWTLLQDSSEVTCDTTCTGVATGGLFGRGNYALEYTPGGHQAATGDLPYCLSVENTYPTVGGKVVQRWALVLRYCDNLGKTTIAPGTKDTIPALIANPNPYQLWGLADVPGPYLQLEDIALTEVAFQHGFPSGDFVVDDRAFGGSGTWGLAYPNHFGLNQEGTAVGCTQPITKFNPNDFNCPATA